MSRLFHEAFRGDSALVRKLQEHGYTMIKREGDICYAWVTSSLQFKETLNKLNK